MKRKERREERRRKRDNEARERREIRGQKEANIQHRGWRRQKGEVKCENKEKNEVNREA